MLRTHLARSLTRTGQHMSVHVSQAHLSGLPAHMRAGHTHTLSLLYAQALSVASTQADDNESSDGNLSPISFIEKVLSYDSILDCEGACALPFPFPLLIEPIACAHDIYLPPLRR